MLDRAIYSTGEAYMKKLNKTYITGALCILFAIWIIFETGSISDKLVSNEPGPRFFPYISAVGIIICSLLSIIFDGKKDMHKPYLTKDGWKRLFVIFAELILMTIGMKYIGFLISGIIMMIIIVFTLKGERKINKTFAIIFSIVLVAALYFGFVKGFSIPLPQGSLWRSLGIKMPF